MKKLNILSMLSVLFLLFLVTVSNSQEAEEVGIVTAVKGVVEVSNYTGVQFVDVGSIVLIGDIFETSDESGVKIMLNDDSLLSLGENTSFEISEFIYTSTKRKSISNITKGKLRAILKKIEGNDSNIEFVTPNAVAGIKGTILFIHIEDGVFAVKEGVVAVKGTAKFSNEVILNPNQFTTIVNGSPMQPKLMSDEIWNGYFNQSNIAELVPNIITLSKTDFSTGSVSGVILPISEFDKLTEFPTLPPINLTSPVSNIVPVTIIAN